MSVLKRLGIPKKEGTVFPSISDLDCQIGHIERAERALRNVFIGGKPLFTKHNGNIES